MADPLGVDISDAILALLASGGGAAMVAYGIFRVLGKSWLDDMFAQRLESFRHQNAKELQALKANIDGALNVRFRVQEKEFEVLSECWRLMNLAFGKTYAFVSPMQEYQDVGRMSEGAREEYVNRLDILDFQKKEILESANPTGEYMRIENIRRHNDAINAHIEFRNCVSIHEIFMSEQTVKDFRSIADHIYGAIVNKRIAQESDDFRMGHEAWSDLKEKCAPEVSRISSDLRSYFRSSLATD
ncbi:hypothetical protein [Rhodovulum marinum]|uniref:Uncharacterized protein n=1 Tax=Rhodovulum marinum TaxID=320662 RepID=A0A4R2PZA3_9RHOB|nr:hypothetical protein [Rhodovulum marinum]TCP41389.1 hypothetical protein EV662_105136 [Rhodovulum marinum]